MIVAVHQPNFLPWLGFFDKAARADVLVLHDSATFSRKERTHRVQVLVEDRAEWITVPIVSTGGERSIQDALIDDDQRWRGKVVGRMKSSYRGAPHAEDMLPLVEEVVRHPEGSLSRFNEFGIRALLAALGLEVELVWSSDLPGDAQGNTRNLELVRGVGGDVYLSGDGAGEYQDPEPFRAAGVELRLQNYSPPEYPQGRGGFVPGLSIVDALMWAGPERTRALLGRRGS